MTEVTSPPAFRGIALAITDAAAAVLGDRVDGRRITADTSLAALPKPLAVLVAREDIEAGRLPLNLSRGVAFLLVLRCERIPADLHGIDDVVFATADTEEIVWRAERALRPAERPLVELDEAGLRAGETHIPLSLAEHRLLTLLLSRPGTPRSRTELCDALGAGADEGRALDAHIYRLRRKLADVPAMRLETLRQRGFRLTLDDAARRTALRIDVQRHAG